MNDQLQALLGQLDTPAFGHGPATGGSGDDRRGRYWLVTEEQVLLAVKVALITGRPLLVEGPSGSGKSSLARAVGETLGWTYYETVVTSQTRLDSLTGWVDLVQRLHQAEVAGRLRDEPFPGLEAFVRPGVLWWALDPTSAASAGQGGNPDPGVAARRPSDDDGAVVLIDEIDKAEPDLPNNLLVPLGSSELRVEGRLAPVTLRRRRRPLVVITSNRERDMPPAFVRRCVMLELTYPDREQLVEIARQYVGADQHDLAELVAERLVPDDNDQVSPAEFVDAVRAADGLGLGSRDSVRMWEVVRAIVFGSGAARARG